jgi:hypothetical protein
MKTPSVSPDAGGVFSFGVAWQQPPTSAKIFREVHVPISAMLARIRELIPKQNDRHYDEIVRGFGVGELRTPASPMSDRELAQAIAEFMKDAPSGEAVSSLGRRLNPSSGV